MLRNLIFYSNFSENEVTECIDYFDNLLNPIYHLQLNDKVGLIQVTNKEDNLIQKFINKSNIKWEIYVDKNTYYQSISRWYYGMNRREVFKNLLIIFQTYNKLLSYLKSPFSPKTEFSNNCLKRLDEIAEKTEVGLEILKITYDDDDDIKHLINNYFDLLSNTFY